MFESNIFKYEHNLCSIDLGCKYWEIMFSFIEINQKILTKDM